MNETGRVCKIVSFLIAVIGAIGSIFITYSLSGDYGTYASTRFGTNPAIFAKAFLASASSVAVLALILYSIGELLDRLSIIHREMENLNFKISDIENEPVPRYSNQDNQTVPENPNNTSLLKPIKIENKIATFAARPQKSIVCPTCQTNQNADRQCCYSCGCKFLFSDETDQQI